MSTNIFEKAVRSKLRFDCGKGRISVEDLWDLSLESLKILSKPISKAIKDNEEDDDFFNEDSPKKSKEIEELELKLEIVKHVYTTLKAERDAKKLAKAKAEEKRRLMELISQKEDQELSNKSLDELRKLVESLDQ